MKCTIVRSNESKTGYAINVYDGQELVDVKLINETYKDEGDVLKLPENPANAKWYTVRKLERQLEKSDEIEVPYRETRVLGQRVTGEIKPKKSWLTWATEEEKAIIDEIQQRCIKRMDEQLNDPKYKLKMEIERKQAQLAELLKKLEQQD